MLHTAAQLQEHGITVNIQYYQFGTESWKFLTSYWCSRHSPSEKKVVAIQNYPKPTTFKQLRTFNGLISIYRRFMSNHTSLMRPLKNKFHGSISLEDSEKNAFPTVKEVITTVTVLGHQGIMAPISITVDTPDSAIGRDLQQLDCCKTVNRSIELSVDNSLSCTAPSTQSVRPIIYSVCRP